MYTYQHKDMYTYQHKEIKHFQHYLSRILENVSISYMKGLVVHETK